ncbi:MAG: response regulator [Inquilinus sp.]|nr:response regulator [Inquilinus sp.]
MSTPLQHILCGEDENDIREVLRLSLEAVGGFTVDVCSSGPEALRRAPELDPDLILLDVMMPGMDGPTTFGELRKVPSLRQTPVMFLTAKVQPSEVSQYTSLGAIGVLSKPFDPMTLPDHIRDAWGEHHG